ncbi:MAG: peptidylprolyl isomerase [Ilumatobacteraceae bacterium]
MKRALLSIGLTCLVGLMIAAPCSAYTPPETSPRIVVTTSRGTILVALAPENAPRHVEQFLIALAAGDFNGANVVRVAPKFYAQVVARVGAAQLSGLPVERLKVGNLRRAFSVYDSGKPGEAPTLMFALVKSTQLDPDYTSIGFVEAGMRLLADIAETPTTGDHVPTEPITILEIHVASPTERALLRQSEVTSTDDDGTSVLAAIFILASAAFIAAVISAFHDRLGRQRIKSLILVVALLSFFALWVAVGGSGHGSGIVGVGLFAGAIAMFRLMGRFERPMPRTSTDPPSDATRSSTGPQTDVSTSATKPGELAHGELHPEAGIDQAEGEPEVVLTK